MPKPNFLTHFLIYMCTDLEISSNHNNKILLETSVENVKQFVDEKEGAPLSDLCSKY